MNTQIPESDWRVFRELREIALQRFCARVLDEAARIAAGDSETPHARYVALYRHMQKRDRELADAFNDPKRSQMIFQLAAIRVHDLLAPDEFSRFTPQTRDVVEALAGAERGRPGPSGA